MTSRAELKFMQNLQRAKIKSSNQSTNKPPTLNKQSSSKSSRKETISEDEISETIESPPKTPPQIQQSLTDSMSYIPQIPVAHTEPEKISDTNIDIAENNTQSNIDNIEENEPIQIDVLCAHIIKKNCGSLCLCSYRFIMLMFAMLAVLLLWNIVNK